MIRLETVEDFEKIKKALENPDSKPWQYRITSFGYCTACGEATAYEGNYNIEDISETCLECNRTFKKSESVTNFMVSEDSHYYFTHPTNHIPGRFLDQLRMLDSRENQKIIYQAKLSARIKKLKSAARSANNQLRQLAKLRLS